MPSLMGSSTSTKAVYQPVWDFPKRATYRKMVQNLWWATGYNAVAIPLAAGAAYTAGIVLSPAAGAALMSVSTIIVAINAKLLERGGEGATATSP